MNPKLEKILYNYDSAITVKREITAFMDYLWPYNPQYEIIFIEKSFGIIFIGKDVSKFEIGD